MPRKAPARSTKAQLEQPVAARRLQVIVPLWGRPADQFDLAAVQSEALIGRARLRFDGPVVGEQDALRTALDDGGGNGAIGHIGQALRREQHRDVLLPERFQPLADACGKQRMVEEYPCFVEHQQRRPTVEPLFQPMEQIGQHRRDDA